MASIVDPLVVGRVIGDVVDMFVPTVTMSVRYGSKHIANGCEIKPSMAAEPPRVTINGHPNELYTLVMTDPDAPSPSEPSMREYVQWIVTDIPGGGTPTHGKILLCSPNIRISSRERDTVPWCNCRSGLRLYRTRVALVQLS
ncbi:unnamed protein product [Ilex paraguariensis]|uniref:Uncharacterized protein n=1 Tax=Ilex paraguariensis TaxID=185542 RepID=A0ABC8R6S1_9AQUA